MRIAIVADVGVAGEALRRIVLSRPGDRVAWIATDGEAAVERCHEDLPDLILMDLILPLMDGAEATRRIMAQTPCPILVVAGAVAGGSTKVLEALRAGALDAVQMPAWGGDRQRLETAAVKFKIDAIHRLVTDGNASASKGSPHRVLRDSTACDRLVAIGASAGGPAALSTILRGLPPHFSAPIVIVQHVDAQFVPLMASWLNQQSPMPVRIAEEGDRPCAGEALIAGTSDHLVFTDAQSLAYTATPVECHQRPSVDVFFESILHYWRGAVAGVLLTGMGRDGARGLKALRGAGFLTIAQDSASCAVYGMPKAAAEIDAAVKILSVEKIAGQLIDFAAPGRQAPPV